MHLIARGEKKAKHPNEMLGGFFGGVKQTVLFDNYCKKIFVIPEQGLLFGLRNTVSFHSGKKPT